MNADFIRLAEWVAQDIIDTGAATAFMLKGEEDRAEMIIAYAESIGPKIEKLQTKYMTSPEGKQIFREMILLMLQS